MEVLATEEKKKIFRARKTMKISDRQQLDSLHNTLLTAAPALPSPSPPPLMNGTHKDDGQKAGEKDQNNVSDSISPQAQSPTSATSLNSPTPSLSLNLSPSSVSSQSPEALEETTPPTSPGNTANPDLKSTEEEEKGKNSSSESVTPAPTESKEKDTEVTVEVEPKEKPIVLDDPSVDLTEDSPKGLAPCSPSPPPVSDYTEPMDTDGDATKAADPEPSTTETQEDTQPSSPKLTSSDLPSSPPSCSSPSNSASSPSTDRKQKAKISVDEVKKEDDKSDEKNNKKKSTAEVKMEVDWLKVEPKKEEVGESTKPARPASTPPSNRVKEERSSTSGLKRTLSEGYEKESLNVKKEGKKMKLEKEELEAQLEVKITAKAGSHHKLEKIVKKLVEEQMQAFELTMFDKTFKDLKDRVDKLECATKHQAAINTLQAKIARLSKKFGEANQASENKRKQEALAAATAAAAAAAKPASVTISPQIQRPLRNSIEVKSTPTIATPATTSAVVASTAQSATAAAPVPTSTATPSVVSQTPILQLITSSANAATTLATGITTQSSTGTLLLKTTPGSGMVTGGQPLLIQLPLSMNGQPGTLVNIPVSSLSAANPLNKSKTTASTTTFILKHAPAPTTTVSASAPTLATVPALQAAPAQMSPTQLSIGRAVYTGGTGGISTPNAGVSVTTARTPVQSVSVVGALSSASSPAASGPAATGSTAPGPPQGTSLTSKTDNQAAGSTPSKPAAPAPRPKGSVIDLTEDDDDVQVTGVTGVKNPVVATASPAPRPNTVVSVPNSTGPRSSPQSNQGLSSNPQLTVHHRPPQDTQLKPRTVNSLTPARGTNTTLPSLPVAPVPPRLPAEAERTSPPQQPQLKLVPSQTGIVLSWCVAETDQSCAPVDSYHLYAFHQDNSSSSAAQQHWKKIGEVKALPLPMACTLTQFQSGSTYHFAVRAKDIYGRYGTFCEPQCTNVISPTSS